MEKFPTFQSSSTFLKQNAPSKLLTQFEPFPTYTTMSSNTSPIPPTSVTLPVSWIRFAGSDRTDSGDEVESMVMIISDQTVTLPLVSVLKCSCVPSNTTWMT